MDMDKSLPIMGEPSTASFFSDEKEGGVDTSGSCYIPDFPRFVAERIPKDVTLASGYFRVSHKSKPCFSSFVGLLLTFLSCCVSLIIVYLLLSRHFSLKKCTALSSVSSDSFFYEKSIKGASEPEHRAYQTRLKEILLVSPPSCDKDGPKEEAPPTESESKPTSSGLDDKPLIVKAVPMDKLPTEVVEEQPVISPSLQEPVEENNIVSEEPSQQHSKAGEVNGTSSIPEEEQEEGLNSTEIEIPKVENKTEDIPSFREWTQKALEKEEKERKEVKDKKKLQLHNQVVIDKNSTNHSLPSLPETQNGSSVYSDGGGPSVSSGSNGSPNGEASPISLQTSPSSTLRLKKNYASVDCGAKIVATNPESTGSNYIISSSRDEYMLNKCSDKVWFVIELCESIKARRVEIANFELYSSVPNDFRVSLSNVYPSRDWTHFGNFKAQESRDVQVFDSLVDNVFGKYVKVEILSHHGTEHYCPISLFKIFGISEIELMAHDEDEEHHTQEHEEVEEEELNKSKPRGKSSIVTFLKEKVDETIGRVVNVVFNGGNQNNPESVEQSSLHQPQQTPVYTLNCPHCNGTQFQEVAGIMSMELSYLESVLQGHFKLRSYLTEFACERFGFPSFNTSQNSTCTLGSSLYDLYSSVFGSSRMIALCNIAYYNEKVRLALNDSNVGEQESDEEKGRDRIEGNSSSCPENESSVTSSREEKRPSNALSSSDPLPKGDGKGQERDAQETIRPSRVEGGVSNEDKKDTDSSLSSSINSQPVSSSAPSSMLDPPSVVHVPPPASSFVNSAGQEDQEQRSANQRESVWQKLTNRIKSLERNVSFSSGYLEELSVQYKKQIEDLQLSVRQSAESLNSALKSILAEKNERKKLESQIRELSSTLFILSEKVESITSWTFGAHVTFIILEIIVGCYCIVSTNKQISGQFRRYSTYSIESKSPKRGESRNYIAHEEEHMQIKKEVSAQNEEVRSSTPCKRRHSFTNGNEGTAPVVGNKPRRSLDYSAFKADTPEQRPHGISNALTRRQRRRIQQNQRRKISASSKLKSDSGSKDSKKPEIRVQNLFSCILPPIETNNMFGSLNSSVHGDPTPIKQLYANRPCDNNNEGGDSYLGVGSKAAQNSGGKLQQQQQQQQSVKNFLRSKSTSPTRKSETAKQREDFENYNPDEFRNTHSPIPPPV